MSILTASTDGLTLSHRLLENGLRRPGTRAKICPRGQEVHRRPPRQGAEREDRDPVVPEPPGDRRQRGRRRMG